MSSRTACPAWQINGAVRDGFWPGHVGTRARGPFLPSLSPETWTSDFYPSSHPGLARPLGLCPLVFEHSFAKCMCHFLCLFMLLGSFFTCSGVCGSNFSLCDVLETGLVSGMVAVIGMDRWSGTAKGWLPVEVGCTGLCLQDSPCPARDRQWLAGRLDSGRFALGPPSLLGSRSSKCSPYTCLCCG